MIQVNCKIQDCEFPITEAEHVDEAVRILHEHYRMIHPAKAFWTDNQMERIEAYNQNLNELMEAAYGRGWDAEGQPGQVDTLTVSTYLTRHILTDEKHERYCNSAFEEAKAYVEANPLPVPGAAALAQPDGPFIDDYPIDAAPPVAPRFRVRPGRR